jgi:ABC-2 type transport system permease protein
MKTYLAFVKKEFYHILRDTRTLYILFGMPIILVLIFGYTVTNEFRNASVAILDQAKDPLSQELTKKLTATGHFRLVDQLDHPNELEAVFRSGKAKLVVVIPPNFEQGFFGDKASSIQLIADATEPNYATTLINYAQQMIRSFQMEQSGAKTLPYQVSVETRMFYNPQLEGAYNFIPGVVALILMLISAMMTSLTIAREKEMGTMDLLLVSPLSPLVIILGKVSPYVFLSFINAIVVFAMGYYIFGVPILGNLALLLLLCILYLLVALSLGVLISTRSSNQQTAMMVSMFVLLLPTMLLSGFLFPIASMPMVLQLIARIVPARYFIDIQRAIMLKGAGWEAVWYPSMIMSIMVVVLLMAAWRNFKVRYK